MSDFYRTEGNARELMAKGYVEVLNVCVRKDGAIVVAWSGVLHENPMGDELRRMVATAIREEIARFEKGEYNVKQQPPGTTH